MGGRAHINFTLAVLAYSHEGAGACSQNRILTPAFHLMSVCMCEIQFSFDFQVQKHAAKASSLKVFCFFLQTSVTTGFLPFSTKCLENTGFFLPFPPADSGWGGGGRRITFPALCLTPCSVVAKWLQGAWDPYTKDYDRSVGTVNLPVK